MHYHCKQDCLQDYIIPCVAAELGTSQMLVSLRAASNSLGMRGSKQDSAGEASAEDASVAMNGDNPLSSFLGCLMSFLTGTLGLCRELHT